MWTSNELFILPTYIMILLFDSFSGHIVVLRYEGLNWTMAINNCSRYGMKLLQPRNETLMTQLENLMNTTAQKHSIEELWIGLKYDNPTHSYYWQDGSTLSETFWKNDIEEAERENKLCVKVLLHNEVWDVENCSYYLPYVCQYDNDTETLPNLPDVVVFQPDEVPPVTKIISSHESKDVLLWQAKDNPVVSTVLVGIAICLISITMGYLTWKYFLQKRFENMFVIGVKEGPNENERLTRSFGITSKAKDYTK